MGPSAVSSWGNTWGYSWGNTWGSVWGLTRVEESAKSGYWRLYFYQLQEKMLQLDLSKVTESKAVKEAIPKVRFIKGQILPPVPKKPVTKLKSIPAVTHKKHAKTEVVSAEVCYMELVQQIMQSIPRPDYKLLKPIANSTKTKRQKMAAMLLLLAV